MPKTIAAGASGAARATTDGVGMSRERAIVLCADDFGLSAGIDEGILDLAEHGRITATGCMVAGPAFAADAARLSRLGDRIDIGLHFALTDLPTLGPVPSLSEGAGTAPGLRDVLVRSVTGRLDYAEIAAEFGRQVGRFREVMGRSPDFVDGHQHVHIFPTVRRAVLDAFDAGVLDRRETWIRDCRERLGAILGRGVEAPKALFISTLASGFAAKARAAGIVVNAGFGGITAFEPARVAEVFPRFLRELGARPLVMCHPASPAVAADPGDPIAAARRAEYAYLAGERFVADLAAGGVRLARMAEVAA